MSYSDEMTNSVERITLKLNNGESLVFNGRLFSEASWYDEDEDSLTIQKLYHTENNEQIYSIVSGYENKRERRVYRIKTRDNMCTVDNGSTEMTMPLEMLIFAVGSLCGLSEDTAPILDTVEETLRAVNC